MASKEMSDLMRSFEDRQYDPYLGIGWVDMKNRRLADVSKTLASDCPWNSNGLRTISVLHKDYWKRQMHRQRSKYGRHDSIYESDYTQIPRFRIFQEREGDVLVMVGSWIEDWIKDLIVDEFDVEGAEFVVDTHWELGHGWAEEYMT